MKKQTYQKRVINVLFSFAVLLFTTLTQIIPDESLCIHGLSKDRCVTSVKKLSHGRHLPSKCRSRDYPSFGSTSLLSKMFSTPFLQL